MPRDKADQKTYWKCSKKDCGFTWATKLLDDGSCVVEPERKDKRHNHPLEPKQTPIPGSSDAPNILWIGIPEAGNNIAMQRFTSLCFSREGNEIIPDFDMDEVLPLKKFLGKGFVADAGADNDPVIHQSVITMAYAKRNLGVHVEFRNWNWVHRTIEKPDFIPDQLAEHALVIFLSTTIDDSPKGTLSIQSFYEKIQLLAMQHGHMRIYPNTQEMQQDHFKIGDIRVLDMIARNSPERFRFRPRTCFGSGICTLQGEGNQSVVKKSHSCGGNGVEVLVIEEARKKVGCYLETRQKAMRATPRMSQVGPGNPILLHQEYIATLLGFGEFRVFLQAPPHPTGPAKIMAIALTKFEALGGRMVARHILPEDFSGAGENEESWKEKEIELRHFACHIYTQLCARLDANEVYESLKIGVRLDIGISVLDPIGQFFVNEITRWHSADFLSMDILRYPFLEICKGYSAAWSAFLRRL
ncbi:hypothetical protein F5B18DRAFT_669747 [Nemania serpens]|nr:hypothetical protein F5B18DRAFT_669747 [Nemania serpens]